MLLRRFQQQLGRLRCRSMSTWPMTKEPIDFRIPDTEAPEPKLTVSVPQIQTPQEAKRHFNRETQHWSKDHREWFANPIPPCQTQFTSQDIAALLRQPEASTAKILELLTQIVNLGVSFEEETRVADLFRKAAETAMAPSTTFQQREQLKSLALTELSRHGKMKSARNLTLPKLLCVFVAMGANAAKGRYDIALQDGKVAMQVVPVATVRYFFELMTKILSNIVYDSMNSAKLAHASAAVVVESSAPPLPTLLVDLAVAWQKIHGPSKVCCMSIVQVLCQQRFLTWPLEVLSVMQQRVPELITSELIAMIVSVCVARQDYSRVTELTNVMHSLNIVPSSEFFANAIRAALSTRDYRWAVRIYEMCKPWNTSVFAAMVHVCSKTSDGCLEVARIWREIEADSPELDVVAVTLVISCLRAVREYDAALDVYLRYTNPPSNIEPDLYLYPVIVYLLDDMGSFDDLLTVYNRVLLDEKLVRDLGVVCAFMTACMHHCSRCTLLLQKGSGDEDEQILVPDHMIRTKSLLLDFNNEGTELGGVYTTTALLKQSTNQAVTLAIQLKEHLLRTAYFDKPSAIPQPMMMKTIFSNLLQTLCLARLSTEAVALFSEIETLGVMRTPEMFRALILLFCRDNELATARSVLALMLNLNIQPTIAIYCHLTHYHTIAREFAYADFVSAKFFHYPPYSLWFDVITPS